MSSKQSSVQKPQPAQSPKIGLDALYKPVGIQAVSAASICLKSSK